MAPKKKKTDVDKVKSDLNNAAQAVDRAAKNAAFLEQRRRDIFGRSDETWEQTQEDVDALDREFGEEEVLQKEGFMDFLKNKLRNGESEVRVMQIGPKGELIDVTDKVSAGELQPEDIKGVQTDDGRTLAFGRNPQSREAAMRMLQEMVPGLRSPLPSEMPGWRPSSGGKAESIRRMELILEESDKILEHWKK